MRKKGVGRGWVVVEGVVVNRKVFSNLICGRSSGAGQKREFTPRV